MSLREVLLTGSVPMKPASAVFEAVCGCLGDLVQRVPDGEQAGWVETVRVAIAGNEAFEPGTVSRIGTVANFSRESRMVRLKPGLSVSAVKLGSLGFADNAIASYREFKRLRSSGKIRPGVRFQATLAGPATTGGMIELHEEQLLPLIEAPLAQEIRHIVAAIPAEDLTIQIDLAVEVEKVEYERRPGAFDTPIFGLRKFTMVGTTDSVARLVNAIPAEVELGFHLCALWHVYKDAGQDMAVHVDYANELVRKIDRNIAYFHLPTTPEYAAADFAPLKNLKLGLRTKLFLGLIHAADGLEGARRRVRAAQSVVPEFGVAHFCGLSQWGAGPETVAPMLLLHRATAAL